MKNLSLAFLFAAILAGTACGSEPSVDSNSNPGDDAGSVVPPGNDGNGGGGGGGQDVTPQSDSGPGTGGGGQDSGVVDTSDSGTVDTSDGGAGGNQDSGTGGGDQDSGSTADSGSGGGDQDSGTGGGDQDSGSTADSGSGGGGDQDSGTGGGGGTDSGTGGGGDQDAGTGGGQDSGGGDHCTPHSCTYTQGYYRNHTSSVTGLTLGGVSYSASEVLGFLNATPNGDDSLILAKQLIAALLNNGQCDPNASATVAAAQSWMAANKDQDGTLPYCTTCVSQSDPGCTAYSLGQTLDAYNQGNSGTPHCN